MTTPTTEKPKRQPRKKEEQPQSMPEQDKSTEVHGVVQPSAEQNQSDPIKTSGESQAENSPALTQEPESDKAPVQDIQREESVLQDSAVQIPAQSLPDIPVQASETPAVMQEKAKCIIRVTNHGAQPVFEQVTRTTIAAGETKEIECINASFKARALSNFKQYKALGKKLEIEDVTA